MHLAGNMIMIHPQAPLPAASTCVSTPEACAVAPAAIPAAGTTSTPAAAGGGGASAVAVDSASMGGTGDARPPAAVWVELEKMLERMPQDIEAQWRAGLRSSPEAMFKACDNLLESLRESESGPRDIHEEMSSPESHLRMLMDTKVGQEGILVSMGGLRQQGELLSTDVRETAVKIRGGEDLQLRLGKKRTAGRDKEAADQVEIDKMIQESQQNYDTKKAEALAEFEMVFPVSTDSPKLAGLRSKVAAIRDDIRAKEASKDAASAAADEAEELASGEIGEVEMHVAHQRARAVALTTVQEWVKPYLQKAEELIDQASIGDRLAEVGAEAHGLCHHLLELQDKKITQCRENVQHINTVHVLGGALGKELRTLKKLEDVRSKLQAWDESIRTPAFETLLDEKLQRRKLWQDARAELPLLLDSTDSDDSEAAVPGLDDAVFDSSHLLESGDGASLAVLADGASLVDRAAQPTPPATNVKGCKKGSASEHSDFDWQMRDRSKQVLKVIELKADVDGDGLSVFKSPVVFESDAENKVYFEVYYDQIKQPMCFNEVHRKLDGAEYTSVKELQRDVQRIFINCQQYNEEGSDIHKHASMMLKATDRLFAAHREWLNDKSVPAPKDLEPCYICQQTVHEDWHNVLCEECDAACHHCCMDSPAPGEDEPWCCRKCEGSAESTQRPAKRPRTAGGAGFNASDGMEDQ